MGRDTRALLAMAKLPKSYWWLALQHSCHISSLLPWRDGGDMSGWKALTGDTPSAAWVRVWGCLCYPKLYNRQSKVHEQSERHIFVGQCPDQPGYCCVNPVTGAFTSSPHVRFVEQCLPGLVRVGNKDRLNPDIADDFNPNATPTPDPFRVHITDMGDEIVGGDGDDTIDPLAPRTNPLTAGGEAILARRASRRAAVAISEFEAMPGPRPAHACALFYTSSDVSAALAASQLVAPQGYYYLYIGSGPRRDGDFGYQITKISDASVVHVDTKLGGYSHDLRIESVADAVIAIAANSRCLGVLLSVPCDTWSAIRFNKDSDSPEPLRDCDFPDGIPDADGVLPTAAEAANTVADVACAAATACAEHGGRVIAESPVPRGAGSRFAIAGRERHASFWSYKSVRAMCSALALTPAFFDQCMSGCKAMKTTQLSCTPNVVAAVQLNFTPLHCTGAHTHASLLGGRDEITGDFPSRATATYTPDTCARLADAFVRSSPELNPNLSSVPIPLPVRESPSDTSVASATAIDTASPLDDWAKVLNLDSIGDSRRSVDASAAYLFASREDYVADIERRLDSPSPATPLGGSELDNLANSRSVLIDAIASVSADDITVAELKHTLADVDAAMHMLREAAPLNGAALRSDFLYECGIDDSIFAGAIENFSGDTPSYRQAMASSEYKDWQSAIEAEMDNLERNNTFEMVAEDSLPTWNAQRGTASECIGTLFVFKRKRDEHNVVKQHKCRVCVMGNVQKAKAASSTGVPLDCFSPACRPTTFKTQCAIAAHEGRRCRIFDVDGAFLQGEFPSDRYVYVRPPPGKQHKLNGVNMVWKLNKPLYGMADSGRLWYQTAVDQLVRVQGFTASEYDPCYLWKIFKDGTRIDMSIYVDDAWVTDNASTSADREIEAFATRFKIKIQDQPKQFLGLNINAESDTISISSRAYIEGLASKQLPRPVNSYNSFSTPYSSSFTSDYETAQLRAHTLDPELTQRFGSKVGALIYASPTTRTDCSWVIGMLARCLTFPTPEMDAAADRVIAYLHQHRSDAVVFSKQVGELEPVAYSDSDWAVKPSTTGWLIKLAGACVAYASKRQLCISLSSTEAEVMAASAAATEIIYQRGLMREMGIQLTKPTTLYVDNTSAIALLKNAKSCVRTRHIERRYLKIRELVDAGHIRLQYVNTAENHADVLTKALPFADFKRHKDALLQHA